MNGTNKTVIICNGSLEIKALIYRDAENNTYAKINKQFFSIETLKYLGWEIKAPG